MKIITGDITQVTSGYIIHQVNCQGAMGAGVAKALCTKWPDVKTKYKLLCMNRADTELLGIRQHILVDDNLIVVNSFSQLEYGRFGKFTYEHLLIRNIETICKLAEKEGKQVYIPYKIGCGLAGGDWNTILAGINHLNVNIVKLPE